MLYLLYYTEQNIRSLNFKYLASQLKYQSLSLRHYLKIWWQNWSQFLDTFEDILSTHLYYTQWHMAGKYWIISINNNGWFDVDWLPSYVPYLPIDIMSYSIFFFFLVIVTSLLVLRTQTQLFEDWTLCKDMHVLLNKCLAGSQARFDVISRYTLVRIMIECDRCHHRRLIEHFPWQLENIFIVAFNYWIINNGWLT